MRRLRAIVAAAALLALAAVLPVAASAAPAGFARVATAAAGAPHGDGGRWVAYASARDTLRVLDERTRTAWSERIPCPTPRWGDPVSDVGGGVALVACDDGRTIGSRPLLLELATRRWRELAGAEALRARYGGERSDGVSFDEIGARWVHVLAAGYHWRHDRWLDWRTGAEGPQPTTTRATDLDAAALQIPLCAPLRRAPTPPLSRDVEPPVEPLAYARPYALLGGGQTMLRLRRCGSRTTLELDSSMSRSVQLTTGVASWIAPTGVQELRLLRCGRQRTWRGRVAVSLHTRRWLYRATLDRDADGDGVSRYAIARLRLPRC